MNRKIIFGGLLVQILAVSAVGLGAYAYNAGIAQGLAQSGKLVAPSDGALPYLVHPGAFYFGPPGFGFGCFGLLVPLAFLFLFFSVMRGFMGHGWGHRHAWRSEGPWSKDVPPVFEEWHKRAHGQSPEEGAQPPASG